MIFKQFNFYTHKNMLDCAIFILESCEMQNGDYDLKICWFNKRGLNIGIIEKIIIHRDQIGNWYALNV